jgi:polynucleotide 5'-kinase involved in rRNA processing
MGSFARGWVKRLERDAEGLHHTLTLPDGREVRYTPEEMLDAVIAAIDEEEHHLLPYIRQMDTREGIAGLVGAIEGSNADE